MDKKVRGGNVMLKLDMMKAYDRVEWNFLVLLLRSFGFCEGFISLIKACLSNQFYSVKFNGRMFGFFPPTRGLRQGDPISPALFIIAEEALSRGLKLLFSRRLVDRFFLGRNVLSVSHLIFF